MITHSTYYQTCEPLEYLLWDTALIPQNAEERRKSPFADPVNARDAYIAGRAYHSLQNRIKTYQILNALEMSTIVTASIVSTFIPKSDALVNKLHNAWKAKISEVENEWQNESMALRPYEGTISFQNGIAVEKYRDKAKVFWTATMGALVYYFIHEIVAKM